MECCGHLSAFEIAGDRYNVQPDYGEGFGFFVEYEESKSMAVPVSSVFKPRLSCCYEYDFGSTTRLKLKVVEERTASSLIDSVTLIARNNPIQFGCVKCGDPASQLCCECQWQEEAWFCDDCRLSHLDHEEFLMPIVNSPRMGVCGYTGPQEPVEMLTR
ncbi:MAG: hypothetical protein ACE5JX_05075 [Acidobacteriota bacterium]